MTGKVKFKVGDYVKIADGTEIEDNSESTVDWQGKVVEAPDTPIGAYLIALDAPTLGKLTTPPTSLTNSWPIIMTG